MNLADIPITNRKDEHILLVSTKDVECKRTTMLEDVEFVHDTLPDLDLDQIDVSKTFLDKSMDAPLIIGAMTGGTELTKKINVKLAKNAQKFNIPMMVGSQRVILKRPDTATSFSAIRDHAPDVPIVGNIGLAQVAMSDNFDYVDKLIDNINANALAVHLNAIQEVIQPEGDKKFANAIKNIEKLKDQIDIPIIIKETGCGISNEVAKDLFDIGIKIIDVSGVGGTSWVAVEYYRALEHDMKTKMALGKLFWDWGIPTAASIIEVKSAASQHPGVQIIGSGGIRTGIDVAKAIRLGAGFAAMARPLLMEVLKDEKALTDFIQQVITELKIAMLLTGSKNLVELQKAPIVISGALKNWMEERKNKILIP